MLNSVTILYELFFIYVSAEEISRDIIIYMLQLKKSTLLLNLINKFEITSRKY